MMPGVDADASPPEVPRQVPRQGSRQGPRRGSRQGPRAVPADSLHDDLRPWRSLPRLEAPIELRECDAKIDGLFDLPPGSAATLAQVTGDGAVHTTRWRGTGETGFYPASTIKWITGAMTVALLEAHRWPIDSVLHLGDDPPRTFRDLLLAMLVVSDNDAFNTLQETVGFAETHAWLKRWGVAHGLIRRHFRQPRYNHSRAAFVVTPTGARHPIAARPAADIPRSADPRPAPLGNPEANYFTTDDLIRIGVASLAGPLREAKDFDLFTAGLAWTNQCDVREGIAGVPGGPPFVVLNKPGWWPPDGANCELCYLFEVGRRRHFFLAVYCQGDEATARQKIRGMGRSLVTALAAGTLELA